MNAPIIASKIEQWPVDRLRPYERNARTHDEGQVAKIAASIAEFGFTNPILVDSADGIIAGHGRLMAAKELGLDAVPVIVLDHLTDAQRRAYILADNRLALDAGWDNDMLAAELADLQDEGFDLDLTGFNDQELEDLLADAKDLDGNGSGDGEGGGGDEENIYTKKITVPIYEPKGEKPEITELYGADRYKAVMTAIDAAEVPEDVREFLRLAAGRHVKVNYQKVAEFYAHTKDESVRELFRDSALVIIDFDAAIEKGYVRLSEEITALNTAGVDDAAE